ncbi:MAG: hypothetical protein AAFV45_00090 [Pseudomonadota bacterium]
MCSILRVFYLLVTCLILVPASVAPAWAATLQGTWSGSGYINPSEGKREKVRCRITYSRQTPKIYSVRAVCATASGKVNQTGEVLMVNPNRYIGDFYNPEFDISGRVRVTISGSRQTVTLFGSRGSGRVTLTKR